MVSREGAHMIVGIIGNVISFALFASPAPTIWRILKNKSEEDFNPDPYIATVMNCLLWVLYGQPWVHPDNTLVLTINGIGLGLELIYLIIFFIYGPNKDRLKIGIFVVIEFAVVCMVGGLVFRLSHTCTQRSAVVGIICVVFGIIMYASPLTIMKTVISTKSVEFMPFNLSLTNFLNGVCWMIYALLKFDLYILISNGVGAFLGFLQLILYGCYFKSTPKRGGDDDNKKPSEVQLQRV